MFEKQRMENNQMVIDGKIKTLEELYQQTTGQPLEKVNEEVDVWSLQIEDMPLEIIEKVYQDTGVHPFFLIICLRLGIYKISISDIIIPLEAHYPNYTTIQRDFLNYIKHFML